MDEYLGDGVYASFDGYHVWLDTRAQEPINRIGLEPTVLRAFQEYISRIEKATDPQIEDVPR